MIRQGNTPYMQVALSNLELNSRLVKAVHGIGQQLARSQPAPAAVPLDGPISKPGLGAIRALELAEMAVYHLARSWKDRKNDIDRTLAMVKVNASTIQSARTALKQIDWTDVEAYRALDMALDGEHFDDALFHRALRALARLRLDALSLSETSTAKPAKA